MDSLVTFVFVVAAAAAGFHGDLARLALPSFHAGARPAGVEQSTSAVCATAVRTTVCTPDTTQTINNNNNNDRLRAFDPGHKQSINLFIKITHHMIIITE